MVQDLKGNIIFWNLGAERIYGFTKVEALSMSSLKLVPKNRRDEAMALMKRLKHKEQVEPYETQRVTKDKRILDVLVTVTMLVDETDRSTAVATTERDITERKRLEREMLEIAEREQRLIGQELHDSMGQMLVGIAVRGKSLELKLKKKSPKESDEAGAICELTNELIKQTRRLARMLYPVNVKGGGLVSALEGLASNTENILDISCQFKCKNVYRLEDPVTARHLYRIAQEAITNAAKHGNPRNILIELTSGEDRSILKVVNDGIDFPGMRTQKSGIGLKIMKYRADMIGGSLAVCRGRKGGTVVTCTFPHMED